MLEVFLTVILPVFVVAGLSGVLQRWKNLSVGALSPVVVYLLSPALVFMFILNAELPRSTSIKLVAASILCTIGFGVIAALVSLATGQTRALRSGFLLATMFPNAGNMGLPMSYLAFGDPGLTAAIVIFVTQGSIAWPIAIFIAARSGSHGFGRLITALKVPTIYAVFAAAFVRIIGWELPIGISVPLQFMADSCMPLMLVILGFQLSQGIEIERWKSLAAALLIRLVISVPIAYFITFVLSIDGVSQKTLIAVCAMPSAVFTTLLAHEFNSEPRFVTSATIASTFASLVTLTIVISGLNFVLG